MGKEINLSDVQAVRGVLNAQKTPSGKRMVYHDGYFYEVDMAKKRRPARRAKAKKPGKKKGKWGYR